MWMMMLFCNQQSGITGVCLLREVVDFFFLPGLAERLKSVILASREYGIDSIGAGV